MTVGHLRLAGCLLVGAPLVAAGYPFVSQVAAPNLNPVSSALKNWTCADQARVAQVSFCETLPPPSPNDQVAWNIGQEVTAARIGLMATVHGISLQTVPMTWGNLWVEDRIDQPTRRLLATTLDGDLQRIGQDFGRPFSVRPKVITFATAGSFEKGLQTLFGYPPQVARALAANNGGALIVPLRSIAVNWELLSRERPLTILRHELAHAMIREVTGPSAIIPSWFDEGLATMEQSSWTLAEDNRTSLPRSSAAARPRSPSYRARTTGSSRAAGSRVATTRSRRWRSTRCSARTTTPIRWPAELKSYLRMREPHARIQVTRTV